MKNEAERQGYEAGLEIQKKRMKRWVVLIFFGVPLVATVWTGLWKYLIGFYIGIILWEFVFFMENVINKKVSK